MWMECFSLGTNRSVKLLMLMVEYPTGYEGPLFENVDGMLFVRN
nr:MAG TPA: hypothetical protein [Caudoviricetes sp.]